MFLASHKAARRQEKIYDPGLMGKLKLREGATLPGEEALSWEMRVTEDGAGETSSSKPEQGVPCGLCGHSGKRVRRGSILLRDTL